MKEEDLRKLPALSIPYAELKISKDQEGNLKVMDRLRRKYVSLTPEEFVRQNFIEWLISNRSYPPTLMANEVEIKLNNTKKRCDSIVFNRECKPLMIIEYKAPGVEITQTTFDQIVRYNMELKAKYLVVTNGRQNYCCIIDYKNDSYNFIPLIPDYKDAVGMPGVN